MARKLTGFARSNCPFCKELVPVGFWDLWPNRGMVPQVVRCSSCRMDVRVSSVTGLAAMAGSAAAGFLMLVASMLVDRYVSLAGHAYLVMVFVSGGLILGGTLAGRKALQFLPATERERLKAAKSRRLTPRRRARKKRPR